MLRFYLRLVLAPVVLLTAALLVIRARPYDDRDIRTILMPEGCSVPCFMGIRPGVTSVDEAIGMLQASGWLDHYAYEPDGTAIVIKWNDQRPAWFVNDRQTGNSYLWIERGVVSLINIETKLSLGQMQLSMGQPTFQHIARNDFYNQHHYLLYMAAYTDDHLMMTISRDCRLQNRRINWFDSVFLNYSLTITKERFPPAFRSAWFDVVRTVCE